MRTGAGAFAAIALAVAVAACGDDGGESAAPKEPVVACGGAHAGAARVAIEPKFRPGDRRVVRIEKTREDSKEGGPAAGTLNSELRVISGGPVKAALGWKLGEIEVPAPEGVSKEAIEKIATIGRGVEIEYSTDPEGSYERILNVDEVRREVRKAFDVAVEGDPEIERFESTIRALVESEATIQATVAQDPALLHGAYGLTAVRGKPQRFPYELPNPFGGEPIAATAEFEHVDASDAAGCVATRLTVEPDRAALQRVLEDVFERFGRGRRVPEGVFEDMKIRNVVDFRWDRASGWMAEVEAVRSVRGGGRSRIERTVITTAPG